MRNSKIGTYHAALPQAISPMVHYFRKSIRGKSVPTNRFPTRYAMTLILIMLLTLMSCARTLQAPSQLQGDFRVHDPAMIKQGDTYYIFSTGDERYHQGNISWLAGRRLLPAHMSIATANR